MTKEELRHYSRALDEIYRLRTLLAYEAAVTRANLDFETLPKTSRVAMERQVERMLLAARGGSRDAIPTIALGIEPWRVRKDAGLPEGFTREDWESEP